MVAVEAVSNAWESPAVGVDGPDYVNAALLVHTPWSKEWLMTALKEIEGKLGRVRNRNASPRVTIDIDMLVFDQEIVEDDLWSHAYRAVPVAELVPGLICPSTGESIMQAAARLSACSPISRRPDIFAGTRWTARPLTTPTSSTRTSI